MAAKIFRINYKSDFILTMNSEAGWTIPFCIKFWTSIPMRAYYVGFDGTTYTHCAYDPAEPTKLLVQFDDHHLPIGNLHFQIAYHFTVEDFPNNTEDEVFNATAITTEIDGETYQVMLDFTGETAPGIDFNMPSVGVTSVNGKIGAVTLNAEDVGAQPTISDLATIRSGSEAGATAVQPAALTPIENDIDTIEGKIPSAASTSNQLADKAFVNSALADKADTSDIPTALSQLSQDSTHRVVTDAEKSTWNGKQNAISDLATIRSGAAAGATAVQPAAMNTALAAKQDTLTFDNAPTANSNNPVKSSGIKTALDAKQSTISTVNVTVDNNTGTPSGSASVSGSTLSLSFQNLKGATGATGATGPQGPQGERGLPGESGVTGDVSGFTVIQTIDPSATYGATDIAGAATVQATNAELTELGGLSVQINNIDLDVNGKFYITGKTTNQTNPDRIDGLSFKAGVTYICTHTNNIQGAACGIYDANNTQICGLSLIGDALSRTNQFTPSSDIENGYVKFWGDTYTLSIVTSSSLKKDVEELGDKTKDLPVQINNIDLDVNGKFYITGKTTNQTNPDRIDGLSFKAGVTYICTHTNNIQGAACGIYDANNTQICGLSLIGDALSKTNQFTPSSDIENGYVKFWGDTYTLSIVASSSLKKDVEELGDKTKDLSNSLEKKVDVSSKNEFKIGDVLESTLLGNDGTVYTGTAYAAYTTCDFFVVEPNTTYCTTIGQNLRTVCFYNIDKNVPCLGNANKATIFTTPANTAYIRFSVKNEWLETTSIVKGNNPIPFIPYNPIYNYINLTEKVDANGELSDNVLDKNAIILNKTFMYNNGELLESDSYCTLDFFEVEPNQYYSCSKECGTFRKVCYFDDNKNFISGGSGFLENVSTFVTPSNCKYVRISLPIAYFNSFMLTKGVTPLPFSPYNQIQGYLNHDTFSYKNIEKIKEFTLKEWSKLQFGMFIHWGVYSAWAGKYDGLDIDGNEIHRTDGTEWMWWSFKIPKATYKAKVSDFSSNGWNPELLCKLAKSVGMEYIVLTIRHHEGFSLMPTKLCEWDITTSSASHDVVMELKKACDKYHIKFCVYISALLDWNDYGGFGQEKWHENVDPYTEKEHVSFASQQADYCRQIVDTYKPYLIWFDGGTYISQPNSVREVFIQKQMAYFPFEITNNRGSQKSYDWIEKEDMYADEPNYSGYLERCNHIAGWGYNETNDTPNITRNVNSRLWDIFEAIGRGFNYLLNIPPKGDGSISDNYINWFKELSAFCKKYTYFNGSTRLFNNCQPNWGRPMYIGNSIYMLVLPSNSSNVYVESIDTGNLIGVHIYNIESPDSAANYEIISDDRLLIKNVPVHSESLNPENVTPEEYFSVVRIDFNGPVWCGDYNYVDTSLNTCSIVRVSSKSWPVIETGIRFNSKKYFIGEDNSVSRTRFKYVGTTGTKSINFTIEATGTNSVSAEFIDETVSTTQTVVLSNNTLSGVTLTNGHIYTMNISKSGDGNLKISNIISIEEAG